jgi:hypothetical protein
MHQACFLGEQALLWGEAPVLLGPGEDYGAGMLQAGSR